MTIFQVFNYLQTQRAPFSCFIDLVFDECDPACPHCSGKAAGRGIEAQFKLHQRAWDVMMSTTLQFLEQLHQNGVGRENTKSEQASHPVKISCCPKALNFSMRQGRTFDLQGCRNSLKNKPSSSGLISELQSLLQRLLILLQNNKKHALNLV